MRPSRLIPKFALVTLAALIAVGVLAIVGSYTFLPPMLENSLARDVQDQLELKQEPQVKLASDPQYRLLSGKFSSGRVTLEEPEFAGIRPERVTVRFGSFDTDVLQSIESGRLKPEGKLSGRLLVEVSQDEVKRIVRQNANGAPITGVKLENGRISVGSKVPAFGFQVPVSVEGNLSINRGKLVFEPVKLSAFGTPVPKGVSRNLLSGRGFSYPLGELPYGSKITGVEVEKGKVVFSGEIRRLVAG